MKIISKFSDYYDSGIAYGIDEKLRFKRKSETIDDAVILNPSYVIKQKKRGLHLRAVLKFKLIGFCGEIYPLVHATVEIETRENNKFLYSLIAEHFAYDLQSLEGFLKTHIVALDQEKYYKESYFFNSREKYLYIRRFFENKYTKEKEFFFKYQIPYFLLEEFRAKNAKGLSVIRYATTLLPILKNFKFVEVKKPIDAFQEISMYLGQLRSQEDNTVKIEDKYLVTAKGFDCYSFKTLPEKRARKKC